MKYLKILTIILIVVASIMKLTTHTYNKGWDAGAEKGVKYTLDTVNSLLDKALDDDTVRAIGTLTNDRDTVYYFLNKKTILK